MGLLQALGGIILLAAGAAVQIPVCSTCQWAVRLLDDTMCDEGAENWTVGGGHCARGKGLAALRWVLSSAAPSACHAGGLCEGAAVLRNANRGPSTNRYKTKFLGSLGTHCTCTTLVLSVSSSTKHLRAYMRALGHIYGLKSETQTLPCLVRSVRAYGETRE